MVLHVCPHCKAPLTAEAHADFEEGWDLSASDAVSKLKETVKTKLGISQELLGDLLGKRNALAAPSPDDRSTNATSRTTPEPEPDQPDAVVELEPEESKPELASAASSKPDRSDDSRHVVVASSDRQSDRTSEREASQPVVTSDREPSQPTVTKPATSEPDVSTDETVAARKAGDPPTASVPVRVRRMSSARPKLVIEPEPQGATKQQLLWIGLYTIAVAVLAVAFYRLIF